MTRGVGAFSGTAVEIWVLALLLGVASCGGGGSAGTGPPPPPPVPPPQIVVGMWPESDVLGPGGVREFQAQVYNSGDTRVTWSLLEGAAGGSMSGNTHAPPNSFSTYTAPNSTGTFHVVATSVADPRVSASRAVTIVPSGFRPTGNMVLPREAHTATLLADGQVLVAGGDPCFGYSLVHGPEGDPCPLAEAELFDPANGNFVSTGNMLAQRAVHSATRLNDGKVLIIGGGSAVAELYEPTTGTFSQTGSMGADRAAHTATLLTNGTVLVTGGGSGASVLATAEIYDPQTRAFSPAGGSGMSAPRIWHKATRLQNGQVLITGGLDASGDATVTAELYDPATDRFTVTGSMNEQRARHTSTLLENGSVLVAGGIGPGYTQFGRADIYDPASGTFTETGRLMTERDSHFAILMPDGKVLISGGDNFSTFLRGYTAEIYDPSTAMFTQTGSMYASGRVLSGAVALGDGRVLVTGGGGTGLPAAETYQ